MTYAVNQAFFSTWTPEMAYVLGFWFADGWMGQADRNLHIGFVDGDGSVYWETVPRRKPIIKMFGGIPFLEKLAQAIDGETGVGVAVVRDYSYKTPDISYPGIKAKVLAKWLYTRGNLFLERKAAIAREFNTWQLSKYGWKSQAIMTPQMLRILEL